MQDVLNFPDHEPTVFSPFSLFKAIDAVNYAEQHSVRRKLLDEICKAIAQNVKIMRLELLAVSTRGRETQVYLIVQKS
jgi:hypothetical protein